LVAFREQRQWGCYHTPEALARAVSVEAGELNELFLWGNGPNEDRVADEVADVMIYALNLCDVCGLDPVAVINRKIGVNERRFPASHLTHGDTT
jgi:NTP pyrophosphatase (non-canonical NTP hydrolase)